MQTDASLGFLKQRHNGLMICLMFIRHVPRLLQTPTKIHLTRLSRWNVANQLTYTNPNTMTPMSYYMNRVLPQQNKLIRHCDKHVISWSVIATPPIAPTECGRTIHCHPAWPTRIAPAIFTWKRRKAPSSLDAWPVSEEARRSRATEWTGSSPLGKWDVSRIVEENQDTAKLFLFPP